MLSPPAGIQALVFEALGPRQPWAQNEAWAPSLILLRTMTLVAMVRGKPQFSVYTGGQLGAEERRFAKKPVLRLSPGAVVD